MLLSATVEENQDGQRLDLFLSQMSGEEISRTSIQKWIKGGYVSKPENPEEILKSSWKVKVGETYNLAPPPKSKPVFKPIQMHIPIIFEDETLVVINKPPGLASHGGPGDRLPTLVNGLLFHFQNLSSINGSERPGIVHRLDKPTSGLMVIAKDDKTHIALAKLFQDRKVEKKYFAWLMQAPHQSSGRIESPIGRHKTERLKMCVRGDGRKAITNYKIIKTISSRKGRNFSLAEVIIETGRTHQIRVHFQSLGCPVVGDMLYSRSGSEFQKFGLLLFSQSLKFIHPGTKELLSFEIPFPENFLKFESEAELH